MSIHFKPINFKLMFCYARKIKVISLKVTKELEMNTPATSDLTIHLYHDI